jgi:cytoskeletal protein RodZ
LLLQVPWSNLGQQPVVAELDRLFLVAGPKEDDSTKSQDGSKQGSSPSAASNPEQLERSAKSQRVAAAEAAWLKVRQAATVKTPRNAGSFVAV